MCWTASWREAGREVGVRIHISGAAFGTTSTYPRVGLPVLFIWGPPSFRIAQQDAARTFNIYTYAILSYIKPAEGIGRLWRDIPYTLLGASATNDFSRYNLTIPKGSIHRLKKPL